jgi:MOSC domain-containing protein YiiM
MTLVAVRAGRAQFRESPQGEWRSAIEKQRINGPVHIHDEGVVGDEQADRESHGGPDKAILAYSIEHYPVWQQELGNAQFGPGALGENFEISGQSEKTVCIGDIYEIGDVTVQVSQPRQPCWKPAFLHNLRDLTAQIAKKGRTGWYLRVLNPGVLTLPAPIQLEERPHPHWTIDRANRLLYHRSEDAAARLELARLPQLSLAWQEMLSGRA